MTTLFSSYFRSLYYENTYLPPCDLSEKALSQHLLETENANLAETVQRLISTPEVQKVLSEPLTYDLEEEVPEKCQTLESHGFRLLSTKPNLQTGENVPFYSVIEHSDLPGWIIKSGATRISKDQLLLGPMNNKNEIALFTPEESLFRIPMASRISQVAQESNIDVVVPKKKLVKYSNVENPSNPNTTYCIVSEKLDVLSTSDTVNCIKSMSEERQIEIAQQICSIVKRVGLADASFDNIRLTTDERLAFIDTKPAGLMSVKKPGLWNRIFPSKGASVEKCARIGLYTLQNQTSKGILGTSQSMSDRINCEPGLQAFQDTVKSQYEMLENPKLSKWKIAASIASFGIIPIINAIVALAATVLIKKTLKKLQKINMSYQDAISQIRSISEQRNLMKQFQKNKAPLVKQFFALVEGVQITNKLV